MLHDRPKPNDALVDCVPFLDEVGEEGCLPLEELFLQAGDMINCLASRIERRVAR
jgi:hypothetical protein